MPARGQYLVADPPPIETCPLCGALFVAKAGTEPVARMRDTGEPVAICERCTNVVISVHRAYEADNGRRVHLRRGRPARSDGRG